MAKRCPKCGEIKEPPEFFVQKTGYLSSYCKPCFSVHQTEYRTQRRVADPNFVKRERELRGKCLTKKLPRITYMLGVCRDSAARRKIPFTLSKHDVETLLEKQNWKCLRTGIPFDLVMGQGRRPFAPSIDRIDSALGYSPANIQIVCNVYNYAKNVYSDDDVLTFARALIEHARA